MGHLQDRGLCHCSAATPLCADSQNAVSQHCDRNYVFPVRQSLFLCCNVYNDVVRQKTAHDTSVRHAVWEILSSLLKTPVLNSILNRKV